MKIVLLTRRNVGLIALSWLKAKGFEVAVISDDEDVIGLAEDFGCAVISMSDILDDDMLLSVHWHKIIPKEYLQNRIAVNIHPCLREGYKGKNPVERYIADGRKLASISSHHMTEIVDEGEEIANVPFVTGTCNGYADFYNIAFKEYFQILRFTFQKLGVNP